MLQQINGIISKEIITRQNVRMYLNSSILRRINRNQAVYVFGLNIKGQTSQVGHIDIHRVWFLGRAPAQSAGSKTIEHGVTG